jgi:hypothetical protein
MYKTAISFKNGKLQDKGCSQDNSFILTNLQWGTEINNNE